MPILDSSALAERFHEEATRALVRRVDVKTSLTPNDTQRATLIIAGVYVIAIGLLWCVQIHLHAALWRELTLLSCTPSVLQGVVLIGLCGRLLTVGFHEMSHAFAGVLTCAKIHSIELDRESITDEGGATRMSGGISMITLPAGYIGSCFIGACLIACGFDTNASKVGRVFLGYALVGEEELVDLGFDRGYDWVDCVVLVCGWGSCVGGLKVLFMGVMNCMYALWDIIDDTISRKVNTSDAAVFAKQFGCCPAQAFVFFALGVLVGIADTAAEQAAARDGDISSQAEPNTELPPSRTFAPATNTTKRKCRISRWTRLRIMTEIRSPNAKELSGSRSRSPTRSPRRSPSPPRTRRRKSSSPPLSNHRRDPDGPNVRDVNPERRKERERQLALRMAEIELGTAPPKPEFDAKAEFAKLLNSRSGGVYVPPARLRALQAAAAEDKSSAEYQRLSWDALRKSITGIVNRVNVGNIKHVIPELFQENLVRGRGLFARSIMKAQAASLPFTPIFAALVAVINTKLPQVGELLLTRLISQFRRSFKRNDKIVCHSTTTFIAHLVNQGVAHEIIALQILVLLLEQPTDDSVEIAVGFMREVGAYLAENSPRANNGVYERFRAVLHEGAIDKRVQYMIEVLFQVRKDKYKDNVIVPEGLDLVEEDDQITHQISLDDELLIQIMSKTRKNTRKSGPKYWERIQMTSPEVVEARVIARKMERKLPGITDMTETNLVNLRRTIYLTIMNALSYEEAVHKLMKVNIQEGQEIELCNMIVECCSQERSYSNFYGLIGERFCKVNRVWCESFEEAFANYYETIHRYETNRLRNIARFFGHLIATDGISWAVFSVVKINEDDTTSSSRIFVKILMQELQESMGLKTMSERFKDPTMRESFTNMFPMDDPTGKSTRFAVNYFTALGLGVLTEDMRANLLVRVELQLFRALEQTWKPNGQQWKSPPRRIRRIAQLAQIPIHQTPTRIQTLTTRDMRADAGHSQGHARRRRTVGMIPGAEVAIRPDVASRRTVGLLGGEVFPFGLEIEVAFYTTSTSSWLASCSSRRPG
ncbi:cell cycle control protein (Cwf22), putative [Rhizoctonia solani AG-1 IA]|uniref:Cell cycle control protein (Cwf22), putative n=1 Tax=Thanatephorus cucumeris (strain AG1-IA) TaxID=983506 RepID=L8X5C6_THACA|nr:cell cycle control protein (Cwf22), putative [Rhizoctonia solani AG-1 IA]